MVKPMIGWSLCAKLESVDTSTPIEKFKRIERDLERRLAGRDAKSLDSDSLYYLASFYKYASVAMGGKYSAMSIRLFKQASRKASTVSRDRIDRELAAFLDAVEFDKQAKSARRMLKECMNADIGIASDAAIALAMSYDTVDDYKRAIRPLKDALDMYNKMTLRLKSELKYYQRQLK